MSKHMTYTCIYVFPINTHIHTPTSFFSLRTFHRHNPLSRLRPSLAVVVPMFPFKEFSRIEMTMTIFCGSLCMKLYKKIYILCHYQSNVCILRACVHKESPVQVVRLSWCNFTIINCGPSQKSTSPVTHGLNSPTQKQGPLQRWDVLGGGGCFCHANIWPNLNDPDICCPTCVKPHIQFVPAIQKAGMTLEAVKCLCVYCMCVCVCGGGMFFFLSLHLLQQ